MNAVPGGFAVALAVAHLVVAGRRVAGTGAAQPPDVFLLVALAATLAMTPDDLMISPSPDLPAAVLIVEAAWLMARWYGAQPRSPRAPKPRFSSRSGRWG